MPDHAVVIGINEYPGISTLEGPCNDATEFLDWVTSPGPGGVDSANVHKLLSCDLPRPDDPDNIRMARPGREQIEEKLEEVFLNASPTAHIGHRLWIFVSGHGMSDINRPEAAAVIAANARSTGATFPHVPVTDYVNYFRRNYTFDEIILVMDCCLDVSVLRPLDQKGFLQGNPHPRAGDVKLFIANATVWSRKSFEKKFGGTTRGIFSVALMESFKNAPADGNKVNGRSIKNYIEENVKSIAGDQQIDDPYIWGPGHESIVFYTRSASQASSASSAFKVTVHVENPMLGAVVDLIDGNLNVLESKTADTGTVTFKTGAGLFKLSLRGSDRSKRIEVIEDCEEIL